MTNSKSRNQSHSLFFYIQTGYGLVFYLEFIESQSSLDHDLMVSIWVRAISILADNLNSGRSYNCTGSWFKSEFSDTFALFQHAFELEIDKF